MKLNKAIVGVKIGSSLLTDERGVNREFVLDICRQIAELKRLGKQVFLVTSGAVASDVREYRSKNLRAAVGQARLINLYAEYLGIFDIEVAQILLTDRDILNGAAADNICSSDDVIAQKVILEALSENIVPVINANDAVDNKEMRALEVCADNDRLSKLICLALGAGTMIIGLDEKGLVGNDGKIIHEIRPENLEDILAYVKRGNQKGHGEDGMRTKVMVAGELARAGVRTILAPGRGKDFILLAYRGEKDFGSVFLSE